MSAEQRIMVQIADPEWTQEALYRACILARKGCGDVALVKMVPVQHLGWLGTPWGNMQLTEDDRRELENCQTTAEDYGVRGSAHVFQYFTLVDAIVETAEYLAADVVFATLPRSLIPYWQEFQLQNLRHRLARQGRVLLERKSLFEENSHR